MREGIYCLTANAPGADMRQGAHFFTISERNSAESLRGDRTNEHKADRLTAYHQNL